MKQDNKLRRLDYSILLPALSLALIGVLMVYSAGAYVASELQQPFYFLLRQGIYLVVGLVLMGISYLLNLKVLKNRSWLYLAVGVSITLLILVLIFGDEVNGARAWLNLGFFNVQPAEIIKFVFIWYMAYTLSMNHEKPIRSIGVAIGLLVTSMLLLGMQPDMGSAIIIAAIVTVMVMASGISWKKSLLLMAIGVLALVAVFVGIRYFGEYLPIRDYQLDRFKAYFDPFSYSESAGLQLVNSYYALSRGGIGGVGLGNSVQKSGYLPEPHTDFIMAIIAEELGLILTLIIIAIFFYMVSRIFLLAIRAKDPFNSMICIGIASMFLIQATINLGGVTGLLPITGVTFPFISYGGSSLLISFISIGIVLNISAREKKIKREQKKSRKRRA